MPVQKKLENIIYRYKLLSLALQLIKTTIAALITYQTEITRVAERNETFQIQIYSNTIIIHCQGEREEGVPKPS